MIQTYIPQISNYVNSLTLQLSDSWHIDESFVKMKDGDKKKITLMLLICGTLWIGIQDFLLHQNYLKKEILTELYRQLTKQFITVMAIYLILFTPMLGKHRGKE